MEAALVLRLQKAACSRPGFRRAVLVQDIFRLLNPDETVLKSVSQVCIQASRMIFYEVPLWKISNQVVQQS